MYGCDSVHMLLCTSQCRPNTDQTVWIISIIGLFCLYIYMCDYFNKNERDHFPIFSLYRWLSVGRVVTIRFQIQIRASRQTFWVARVFFLMWLCGAQSGRRARCLARSACRHLQPTGDRMVSSLPTESQRYRENGVYSVRVPSRRS